MKLFVAAIVFAVLMLVAYIGAIGFSAQYKRSASSDAQELAVGFKWVTGIFAGVAVLLFVFSCLTQIGTQDIGVRTSFGKPVGAGLTSGIHMKKPWEKVHRLDAKAQTDTYASSGFDGDVASGAHGSCVKVRIARQATACVNLTIRWQNQKSGVDYLFQNYKTDDNIRENLLHRDAQTAVNIAFAHYDPLGIDAAGNSTQPTNVQLADTVKTSLQDQVGQYLQIHNIFIPIFNFDPATQERLNQLQLQVAQTRIAVQAKQTAIAQAAANKSLAASVSRDPNVLVAKCLDILAEAVNKSQPLPAGFSCFPSSGAGFAVTNKK
jgi:regulator of protease activity HflC (stomatin/prohibitin superfamily)